MRRINGPWNDLTTTWDTMRKIHASLACNAIYNDVTKTTSISSLENN